MNIEIPEEYKNIVGNITFGSSKSSKNGKKKKLIQEATPEKEVILEIPKEKEHEDNPFVNLQGNLISYSGKAIHIIFDKDNNPWFKGKDVATILGYKNTREAILYNIDKINKTKCENLRGVENSTVTKLPKNTGATIYIDKEGMMNLILESNAKCAKDFRKWVAKLLVRIDNGEAIYESDEPKQIQIDHVSGYKNWYDKHTDLDLKDKYNVFYIGIIGKVLNIDENDDTTNANNGEIMFKFGISGVDESKRFTCHKNTIGSYMCVHISSVFRNRQLENDVKCMLDRKSLLRYMKFGSQNYTELFTISDTFVLKDMINYVNNWITKNDYCEDQLSIEKEITRREKIKLKQEETVLEQFKLLNDILKNNDIEDVKKYIGLLTKIN